MSKDNMELYRYPDGRIMLAFWDRAHGEDRLFEILQDGVYEKIDGEWTWAQIDFYAEMKSIIKQMEWDAKSWAKKIQESIKKGG